jgi:hypothetical protein
VTSAQTFDIIRHRGGATVSILAAPLSLAAASESASTTAFAAGITLEAGDYLTIDSAQTGGTPAVNVFVELLLR